VVVASFRRMMMRNFFIFMAVFLAAQFAQAEKPSAVQASSFVLVTEPKLPNTQRFRAQLEQRWGSRHKITDFESDDQKVILIRVAGGTVLVGLIDAPLPKGLIDDLCPVAWYWRGACEATAEHRAHVLVSVSGTTLNKLDASLLQTEVVASLMDANAIASYWGASLQPKDAFLRLSANLKRDAPPAWLWVNFRVSQDVSSGFSVSTQGMEAFDLREIEAKDVNRPGRDVFTLLMGTAQYLLANGPVIRDGDTIGDSPKLNIRVYQGPSYWREDAKVYRVTWPKD
jgi:hypothetical protein